MDASASADEVDDLDPVPFVDDRVGEQMPFENRQVVLDGDAARIDGQPRQQIGHRDRRLELVGFTVERDYQGRCCEDRLSVLRRSGQVKVSP